MDLGCLCKTSREAPARPVRRGLRRSGTGRTKNGREEEPEADLGRDSDNVGQLVVGGRISLNPIAISQPICASDFEADAQAQAQVLSAQRPLLRYRQRDFRTLAPTL